MNELEEIKEEPLVSVLMPVYNAEKHIKEAIESILNQTYTNFDFIIINDGSTDNSENIIVSFNDSRIKYYKNESNIQLIKTLNKGLKLCDGKYIFRMDSDDISVKNRLEKQVNFMERNQEIGVCGGFIKVFDKFDNFRNKIKKYPTNHNDIKISSLFKCSFAHPSVVLRNKIIKDNKITYRDFPHAEDFDLWLQILSITKGANIPEVLLHYRISKNQISSKNSKIQIENTIKSSLDFLKKMGANLVDDNIKIHKNNFIHGSVIDSSLFTNVLKWYEHLIQLNDKKIFFDKEQFSKNIAKKAYHAINADKELKQLILYKKSILDKYHRGKYITVLKNKFQ